MILDDRTSIKEKMKQKERIKYIDLCKGLGILMVTWGHITDYDNPVDTWASSFKMAIFFITAGYLIQYMDSYKKLSLKGYTLKLLRSLGIPYICFSILSIVFRYLSMLMKHSVNMASIKSYIFAVFTFRGIFALWFLPVLFFGEILFFCLIKYGTKRLRIILFFMIPIVGIALSYYINKMEIICSPLVYERISFVILSICRSIIALWFLEIGYIGCKICNKIHRLENRFIIGVIFSIINIFLSQINTGVDLNNMELGNIPFLFFITGILGSFGALFVFEFLEKHLPLNILNYFGKNSLILMCTQRPFYIISISTAGWKIISGMSEIMSKRYYFDCFCIMIIVMIIEYSIITFINSKARFLIGRFS